MNDKDFQEEDKPESGDYTEQLEKADENNMYRMITEAHLLAESGL